MTHKDYTSAKTSFELGIALFDRTGNQFIKAITFMHYAEAILLTKNLQFADTN